MDCSLRFTQRTAWWSEGRRQKGINFKLNDHECAVLLLRWFKKKIALGFFSTVISMRKHIPIQFIMRIKCDRFRVILSSISFSIDSFNQRHEFWVQRFSFFASNFTFLLCLSVIRNLEWVRTQTSIRSELILLYIFQLDHMQSTAVWRARYFCPSSAYLCAHFETSNRFSCVANDLRNEYFSIECSTFSLYVFFRFFILLKFMGI